MQQQQMKGRVAYLDVLKAFAIIAVVLYHSGFLTYGYLGVDLFLVIGGYLITHSLMKRVFGEGKSGYWRFEFSRVARLLPPLLAAGVFCMILGFFTMLPDDYENLAESVVATNGFVNNILAAITTRNYWDVVNEYKPLMHTWYVGILMQFYIIYPLLFYVAKLDKHNPRRTLITIIASLSVISLFVFFGTANAAQRFYYLPSRFFEFAVGGIIALAHKPSEDRPFHTPFVYGCYVLLLALFVVNKEFIPDNIRLVAVVAISGVLIMSGNILNNKVTGNNLIAKIGVASYSIFVWHQVLLAFYRYVLTSHFTIGTYVLYIFATGVMAWLSYRLIEQPTTAALQDAKRRRVFWALVASAFLVLTSFAAYIYMAAGVVRDIPELYVSTENRHRNMHAEYCDRGFQYDKPFETEKPHWFVIGNSFGRDFVNTIVESPIADKVEVSYTDNYKKPENAERFAKADRVFISTLGLNENLVTEIEVLCLANGLSPENLVIVGEKNFGESNGQIYAKRHQTGYFEQYIPVEDEERYIKKNQHFRELYGDRFLDMMALVSNDRGEVRVFSPDHHFISADNRHFSRGGAIYFGQLIDWSRWL